MFIDLVGYTKKTVELNRLEFNELHDTFDHLVLTTIKNHSGNLIKKIGDAFLITFDSPTDAILCGKKLQINFQKHNKLNKKKEPLLIRVALDQGEVIIRGNDVYGDPVNIASRIEGITPPNQIYFSEAMAQTMNKNEVSFVDLGYNEFKGLPHPIRIFRLYWDWEKKARYRSIVKETVLTLIIIGTIIYLFKNYLIDINLISATIKDIFS